MKTNTNITLYNRYVVGNVETYQRTQIGTLGSFSVEWENKKAANVIRSGMLAADSVVVFVPFPVGENHLNPVAWQALLVKTGKWTLQVGDYMVKGLVLDEISTAFTMTALKAKYDNVVRITSVDTFDLGREAMNHWQVGAS